MEPVRLTSKQGGSKQLAPQSNKGPETEKNNTPLSGMVLGQQTNSVGTRKARVSATKVLRAPEWPGQVGPLAGPKWPKITKNGPQCLRGGASEGFVVQVDGKNQFGYYLGCLLAVV